MEHDEVSEEYLLNIRREKTARELDRIRNSFSFRCGQIIAKCLRFPPLILILPFWLFGFCFVRLGTTWAATNPPSQQRSFDSGSSAVLCSFPPTASAWGIHLFAVAKRSEQDPMLRLFLTQWLPCICLNRKASLYHCRLLHVQRHDVTEWNAITEELLATVFEIHRPSVFVFDGAFRTAVCSTPSKPNRPTNVWLRAGRSRKEEQKFQLTALNTFTTSFVRGTVLKRRWRRLISAHSVHISNQFFLPNQKTFSQGKKLGFDWA